MPQKKAFIELQFNWLFAIILGSIIISSFVLISIRSQKLSETSYLIKSANSLDYILANSEFSQDSTNILKIPKAKILFGCNSFQIGEVSKDLSGTAYFSPSVLEDEIIIVNRAWEVPYNAGNFLYLADNKLRYIFIGFSDFTRAAFQIFPDIIPKEGYTTSTAVPYENNKDVRLIFFGQEPEMPISLKDKDIKLTAVKISGSEEYGAITFYDYSKGVFVDKGASNYLGIASLFGAVFSGNSENYECGMRKAFTQLNAVSSVYSKKIGTLISTYGEDAQDKLCFDFYSTAQLNESLAILSKAQIGAHGSALTEAFNSIKESNNRAIALSCAPIY